MQFQAIETQEKLTQNMSTGPQRVWALSKTDVKYYAMWCMNHCQEPLSQTCPTLLVFSGQCHFWSSLSSVQYLRVFPGETSGHKAMFILPLLMFACMQIRWGQTQKKTKNTWNISQILQNSKNFGQMDISNQHLLGSNDLSCNPHCCISAFSVVSVFIRNQNKISFATG